MNEKIELLLKKINKKQIWDEEPVYCFTSDIDWASEAVMENYFEIINPLEIKPTLYVTHESEIIKKNYLEDNIERCIHPNFLKGSSHGDSNEEIIETCLKFSPESIGFRSHRLYDVDDTSHLLERKYNHKHVSNLGTIMQPNIKPILHESGLIHFPIFIQDGTHLYNHLDLNFKKYIDRYTSPGIKIVSFHPMNFIFNSPTMKYMRSIKDSLTREEYNDISRETIDKMRNREDGIGKTTLEIIKWVKEQDFPILSMNELYYKVIK